jgi:hypothetical protein
VGIYTSNMAAMAAGGGHLKTVDLTVRGFVWWLTDSSKFVPILSLSLSLNSCLSEQRRPLHTFLAPLASSLPRTHARSHFLTARFAYCYYSRTKSIYSTIVASVAVPPHVGTRSAHAPAKSNSPNKDVDATAAAASVHVAVIVVLPLFIFLFCSICLI